MKEASCHKGKMAAYSDEVRKLKERFDRLELHHIPRRDSLATNSLAKVMSSQGPANPGVFVNDVDEPSVRTLQPHDQTMDVASKEESAQPVEHHHDPGAVSPLD